MEPIDLSGLDTGEDEEEVIASFKLVFGWLIKKKCIRIKSFSATLASSIVGCCVANDRVFVNAQTDVFASLKYARKRPHFSV